MPDHRGSRFALEVLFLLALAVGLTLADLRPLEIGGVMLLGWLIVAALEWAAWRDEPHYGSGLPPRYYVPTVNLPPARPLEQVPAGYPEAQRDEAPTWIASAALRAEMLGEWPHSAPVEDAEADEPDEAPAVEPPVSLPPPLARCRTTARTSYPSRCRSPSLLPEPAAGAGGSACRRRRGRRARRGDGGFGAAGRARRRRARAGAARRRARALAAGDRAATASTRSQRPPASDGSAAAARPSRCRSSRCRPARTAFGRFPAARPVRISV